MSPAASGAERGCPVPSVVEAQLELEGLVAVGGLDACGSKPVGCALIDRWVADDSGAANGVLVDDFATEVDLVLPAVVAEVGVGGLNILLLAGELTVGDGAAIGARAVVRAGLTVGAWALVGAGAVVVRDVPDYALVVGNPAVQKGWVGRAGVQLVEVDGGWECPETGERYALVDGRMTSA